MLSIDQFFLLKLMEECSEVAQRCSKQVQFGAYEKQANSPSETKNEQPNRDRLRAELNDLLAVVDVLLELGQIPEISPHELLEAKNEKRAKIQKYLNYSQELGLVEKDFKDYGKYPIQNRPGTQNLVAIRTSVSHVTLHNMGIDVQHRNKRSTSAHEGNKVTEIAAAKKLKKEKKSV